MAPTVSPRRLLALAALLSGIALTLSPTTAHAQKKSDSVVKATASADKPDPDGKQVVTITLTMDKGWHIYANPVGLSDLEEAQTLVTISGKEKPAGVKVEYPEGTLVKDKVVGDYKVYEDKTTIKATVTRAKGDTGPLEASIRLQACSKTGCLLPSTIKVNVP
jgi:DsbC/DsbD-like thiol-disulfide interchange protein